MSSQNQTITVAQAQKILKDFDCLNESITVSEKALIREALLLLVSLSDYQMLGICADTTAQGLLALKSYTEALGYEANLDLAEIEGSVYLKFNSKTGLSYLDSYTGKYRGVLVSCQSSEPGAINEMYGHLPLDLFA